MSMPISTRPANNRRNVMVTVKEKTTVTQRIRGNCPTHSRTEISVRDVKAVIDEPKEREGTNMGPTPTETMVAALIACTNVSSHKCAKKHGVGFKAMTIDAESTFDRRFICPSPPLLPASRRSALLPDISWPACGRVHERRVCEGSLRWVFLARSYGQRACAQHSARPASLAGQDQSVEDIRAYEDWHGSCKNPRASDPALGALASHWTKSPELAP